MVGCAAYRNPALLAKITSTVDVISGGRAVLGLGAAWNEEEHIGYGFEFPPIRERMDRLDEALTIKYRDLAASALNQTRAFQLSGGIRSRSP